MIRLNYSFLYSFGIFVTKELSKPRKKHTKEVGHFIICVQDSLSFHEFKSSLSQHRWDHVLRDSSRTFVEKFVLVFKGVSYFL